MTVRELINGLSTLSESAKDKQICFAKNDAPDVFDVYVPERSDSCCVGKYDVTIYIKRALDGVVR